MKISGSIWVEEMYEGAFLLYLHKVEQMSIAVSNIAWNLIEIKGW